MLARCKSFTRSSQSSSSIAHWVPVFFCSSPMVSCACFMASRVFLRSVCALFAFFWADWNWVSKVVAACFAACRWFFRRSISVLSSTSTPDLEMARSTSLCNSATWALVISSASTIFALIAFSAWCIRCARRASARAAFRAGSVVVSDVSTSRSLSPSNDSLSPVPLRLSLTSPIEGRCPPETAVLFLSPFLGGVPPEPFLGGVPPARFPSPFLGGVPPARLPSPFFGGVPPARLPSPFFGGVPPARLPSPFFGGVPPARLPSPFLGGVPSARLPRGFLGRLPAGSFVLSLGWASSS
mmetsp:Transcript_34757/g.77789  ORF Transcript_34757/g.77789 Transcript_34757/m.77789 type:complete len:297 (+) Transcript_34757:301-1191(+)